MTDTSTNTQSHDAHSDEGLKSSLQVQLVVFTLDHEEYAVPIIDLQEIIKVPEITPIPNAPVFIKGILNLRGKIIVVIDLERKFNLLREGETILKHIIITEINGVGFGVLVDEVIEVLNIEKNLIQPAPSLVSSKIHADYLKGVVVLTREHKIMSTITASSDQRANEANLPDTSSPSLKDQSTGSNASDDSRLLIVIDLSRILQESELLGVNETVAHVQESANVLIK